MTKAALLCFGLAALVALPAAALAQDNSTAIAVNEAVLRQANTIVLRQKLADANRVAQAGETAGAAKLYQESCELAQQIGSGIDAESAQAIKGLATARLTLARDAQAHGDLREAATQVNQVLKADPQNAEALAFKGNPVDNLEPLAKAGIPIIHVVGQADTVVPVQENTDLIDGALGELSLFHRTHGFYVHGVSIEAAVLPDGWDQRTVAVCDPHATRGNTGYCLEAHDLAASKLVAGREKDRIFVATLLLEGLIDGDILLERVADLPVERHHRDSISRWVRATKPDVG